MPLQRPSRQYWIAQKRSSGYVEKPIITSGKDLSLIARLLENGKTTYSAADVIEQLLPSPKLELVPV